MFRTVRALVLREVRYRESDRILTALSAEDGKITLSAHGALSRKSRIAASTQQLTYSEFTVFEKNGRLSVREGIVKEGFPGLRSDMEKFALGSYFAEFLELFAGENQPEAELLQLGLNCLYALSEDLGECEKVKTAFELRLAAIEGYAPLAERCPVCGREEIREPVFQPGAGQVVCRACRQSGMALPLDNGALAALRHVLAAPPKKILAFSLPEDSRKKLSSASEAWILHCADRIPASLSFYHSLN
ncbi:MAG: DNA repair protein RecO [Oscillospiraceae bacterium]|nr:DNA repair protein RecO [Oscillospiraceae bacterium]